MADPNQYDQIIKDAALKYGVDPDLLRKMVGAESGGDPNAKSPAGAQGLMQLMPHTAGSLGVTDPNDPHQNIMGGANYISQMLKQFGGDKRKALAAYNFGPGNVSAGKPYPPETTSYLDKILGPDGPPAAGPMAAAPGPGIVPPPGPSSSRIPGGREVAPPMMASGPRPMPAPAPPPPPMPGPGGPPPGPAMASGPAPTPMPAPPPGAAPPSGPQGPGMMAGIGKFLESLMGPGTAQAAGPTVPPQAMRPPGAPGPTPPPPGPAQPDPVDIPAPGNPFLDAAKDPGKFLGRDSFASGPPAMAENAMRQPSNDPIQMLIQHLNSAPNPKDYQPKLGGKLLAGLAGGLSGAASDDPGSGLEKTQTLLHQNYNRALASYKTRGDTIGEVAKYTDAASDRTRNDREELAREGYWKAMSGASQERADKYGTAAAHRNGAQKPVPVGQQNEAWQNAAERVYASDPNAKKYIHREVGKNGPVYWIETDVNRPLMWNRDFTATERAEQQRILQQIDGEAGKFTSKMVDPYDRSGFGASERP